MYFFSCTSSALAEYFISTGTRYIDSLKFQVTSIPTIFHKSGEWPRVCRSVWSGSTRGYFRPCKALSEASRSLVSGRKARSTESTNTWFWNTCASEESSRTFKIKLNYSCRTCNSKRVHISNHIDHLFLDSQIPGYHILFFYSSPWIFEARCRQCG